MKFLAAISWWKPIDPMIERSKSQQILRNMRVRSKLYQAAFSRSKVKICIAFVSQRHEWLSYRRLRQWRLFQFFECSNAPGRNVEEAFGGIPGDAANG